MPFILNIATLLGAFTSTALAHGYVNGIVADGVYTQGWLVSYYYDNINGVPVPDTPGWYEESTDLGFISPTDYQTQNIICNKNAVNANSSASVAAGGTVQFQWTTWPHGIGPVLTYVANCGGDCSTVDKTTLEFVKIDEAGIDLTTQTWAAADLIADNSSWTTTVPSTLAPGSYVFRHEIIADHGAGSLNGAQNYPFCVNIDVTGSGTESPAGTLGTALYNATDPGILFNPYGTLTSYDIPGPALWTGGASSPAASTAPSVPETSGTASSMASASTVLPSSVGSSTSGAATTLQTIATSAPVSSAPVMTSVSTASVSATSSTVSDAPSATPSANPSVDEEDC